MTPSTVKVLCQVMRAASFVYGGRGGEAGGFYKTVRADPRTCQRIFDFDDVWGNMRKKQHASIVIP